jgi:AAA domain
MDDEAMTEAPSVVAVAHPTQTGDALAEAATPLPETPNDSPIGAALKRHFATLNKHFSAESEYKVPTETSLYQLENTFGTLSNYWETEVQSERFDKSFKDGILYRPEITKKLFDLVKCTLDDESGSGIMVKGPQGIGKSHSLVNLVLKLQESGKYLVTFVPDCGRWTSAEYLVKMICRSFGVENPQDIGLSWRAYPDYSPADVETLFEDIDRELESQGKRWVLVYDQISKLFARKKYADSITALGFPDALMGDKLRAGRIISIISASSNEIGYIDSHRGFLEEIHTPEMSDDELSLVFGANIRWDVVREFAGGVPPYVSRLLENPGEFHNTI